MLVGLLSACAVLLGSAGAIKFAEPAATIKALTAMDLPALRPAATPAGVRLIAVAEIGIAVAVLVKGGAVCAGLLTLTFVLLGLVTLRLVRHAPGQDCGCFGNDAVPVGNWHIGVNASCAAVAGMSTLLPQPALVAEFSGDATAAAFLTVGLLVLAYLMYQMMTGLPELLIRREKVGAVIRETAAAGGAR